MSENMPTPDQNRIVITPDMLADQTAQNNALADEFVRDMHAEPNPMDSQWNRSMRSIDGTMGYAATGAMMVAEHPSIAAKVVGAGLIAHGAIKEQLTAAGYEATSESTMGRIRDRIFSAAESLKDKTTGKMNLVARLKRGVADEVLDFEDKEYRNRFNRMVGGMMIGMAGIEVSNQPGVAAKIIAGTMAAVGGAEFFLNGAKTTERYNDLRDEREVYDKINAAR